MRNPGVIASIVMLLLTAGAAAQPDRTKILPVDFSGTVRIVGPLGAAAADLKVHIDRYTAERDRTSLLAALKRNGFQSFLPALRQAPVVGYVQIKDEKWDLRWAHQEKAGTRQIVTVATDRPIYFAGGGRADAKPRDGFEMAVIRLDVDDVGMGKGSLAGAARVRPSTDGQGVQVDEYAGEPAPITTVMRRIP